MRRTVRPELELLEGKALLSVASPASGLVETLTAVASRTLSGSQVLETFTETNVSDHDISVVHGPSNEGFTVSRNGKTIWNPSEGILPQFLEFEDLKPHQSVTVTATWDGRANDVNPAEPWAEGSPLSGTFTISNSLDQSKATATVTIPKSWTGPVKVSHVKPTVPPVQVHAMTTAKPLQ